MVNGQSQILGRNSSSLLDIVRFASALAVLGSHLPTFDVRLRLPAYIGNEAVCIFFVLSGFVIRYVTETRLSTLPEYLIDRASRIYSVVLPALALTVICEAIGCKFPAYSLFTSFQQWSHVPLQLLTSITFTTSFWGYLDTPLSNGPFWSLSFEVVYYILYGLIRYQQKARWVLVPFLLLLSGPSVSALFPVWLLGALLYDVYAKLQVRSYSLRFVLVFSTLLFGTLVALRHLISHLLEATGSAERIAWTTRIFASTAFGRCSFMVRCYLGLTASAQAFT